MNIIGNIEFIRKLYPKLQKLLGLIAARLDENGLVSVEGRWAIDSDYYNKARSGPTTKGNCLYVISLNLMSIIASHLGDTASQTAYTATASRVTEAVNKHLFNSSTGVYDASSNDRNLLSEDANAFAIISGVCPPSRRQNVLSKLRALYTSGGVLSFEESSGYMNEPVVSPIMNGWHAEGAFQTSATASSSTEELDSFNDGMHIMRSCWGPMADVNNVHYTGMHWEFSKPDGTPYMDHFCSMAHPFSSIPTYQLSKYCLGAYPLTPGWKTFAVAPLRGFLETVTEAKGRVPTPYGRIEVEWRKTAEEEDKKVFDIKIVTPAGVEGELSFPDGHEGKRAKYIVGGAEVKADNGQITLRGGMTKEVQVIYD